MRRASRRNWIGEQFAPRTIRMLRSPAYCVLSLSSRRVLDRIEIEMADHGGTDNGKLPVTYDDFERYGIHRHAIGPAIREVVALGFVEITEAGRAGNAEWRKPNLFRLTYRLTKYEPANDGRKSRLPKKRRLSLNPRGHRVGLEKQNQWRKSASFWWWKTSLHGQISRYGNTITSDGAETATTLDISGGGPSSAERPHGGAPNGASAVRRRPSEKTRERREQASGAAYSERAGSPGQRARSDAGGLAPAMTEAKGERPVASDVRKRSEKHSGPVDGIRSSASGSRKIPRHKRAAEVVS